MSKLNILLLLFLFHLASISLYAQENKTKIVIANERESSTFHHTVEKGETVYAIATMYGVKPEDIYRLNPGSKEGIRAGATLQIPQRAAASQKEEHYIFHTIQPKETLYAVSKRYAIPATAIVNANPGLSTSTFQIGKTIRIPAFVKDEGEEESHQKEVSTEVEEIEYTIEKRETLYRICRKFDISSYELLKRNPQLKEGVKAGMKIKIPVLTQKEKPQPKQPKQTAPLNERETNALLAQKPKSEPVQRIKVALLLPFMTNETEPSAETKRFIEYYEGFLIAVDSLRNSGCSIELSVYDTEKGTKTLKRILKEEESLQQVNLLIGAVQNDQINLLASFAEEHRIPYVIPFTSKNDDVLSNAYVYQVNTPHSYLYAKAAQAGCDLFADDHIILLNMHEDKDKTEFLKTFKAEMAQRNIPYSEVDYNSETLVADIDTILQADKRNVIVPSSGTISTLNKIKSPIRMLAEAQPECGLTLFGYPEWQTYTRECLEDFYALNTYIYTNFYANNLSKEVDDFYTRYKNWFSKSLINIFPKYGILGFDTGMFFLGAIRQYGPHFDNKLEQIQYKGIQTEFDFHRVNNWGGFINTNIFIVHYQADFNVTRSDVR